MRVWLNVSEGAEYAGVSRDTIYTAVERGELRHVRIGGAPVDPAQARVDR